MRSNEAKFFPNASENIDEMIMIRIRTPPALDVAEVIEPLFYYLSKRMRTNSSDSALELPIRFQVRKLEGIHIAPGHRSERTLQSLAATKTTV
ncbi:hypothetical protein AKJ16_DCAP11516 [Drosera capensis]